MLVAGAPVANRAWALPDWYRLLAAQTVRPDRIILLHSGFKGDDTWVEAHRCSQMYGLPTLVMHDAHMPHSRGDKNRFKTLARLRNTMLVLSNLSYNPDAFLSIDTDVMLDDPETIAKLHAQLDDGADTASPVTWLHPFGEGSWAYNAGWLTDGYPGWCRIDRDQIPWGEVMNIEVPMAVTLMGRRVLAECRYAWHESGEDIAFGQALKAIDADCRWDTGLKARHLWGPEQL